MWAKILGQALTALLGLLTPELVKKLADMVLDFCEKFVLGTKSEIDDALVIPICDKIRSIFDIPDNDE